MVGELRFRVCVLLAISSAAAAQIISSPTRNDPEVSIGGAAAEETTYRLWQLGEGTFGPHSPLESPNGSISLLDLKAPGKAQREYEKGYQLLQRKDSKAAVDHLVLAISLYSNYVAAHSALGSAYLNLNQNAQARDEFAKAVALDDHLPSAHLNLACAELALHDYPAAEESIRKASAIAPLDLHVLTALAYGQFMNQDYQAAIVTAQQVHGREHKGFAKVHLYAAAAWQGQRNLPAAEQELETFLREDPTSTAATRVTQMLRQLKEAPPPQPAPVSDLTISYAPIPSDDPSAPNRGAAMVSKLAQAAQENREIAEAEEAEKTCPSCGSSGPSGAVAAGSPTRPVSQPKSPGKTPGLTTLYASANEVAVFFVATNHRKSVTNLSAKDIQIRDNHQPPAVITGFRNESQLPLRLGIIIDTSASITDRFKFEQDSAIEFLQKTLTGPDGQAFVIGVNNSVLLVQDFTNDTGLLSHAVAKLAPAGGTALWDAVAFASDKLASRREEPAVAKLLVVISDGQNNSSKITLKQTLDQAQRDEVFIYTVSTKEADEESDVSSAVGKRALQTLAELTGGAAFYPGSLHRLNASLSDLQELIRSRYLISYKPAQFQRDGQYRPIEITAKKDGQKLRIYARKGYFATATPPTSAD